MIFLPILQMYIAIGVGAGGFTFPDNFLNKPYTNRDPKAERRFYDNQTIWYRTWDDSNSQLIVDEIKVTAL